MPYFGTYLSTRKAEAKAESKQARSKPRQQHELYTFELFKTSLLISGYQSYSHYLNSDEWKKAIEWYRECNLPKLCLVCRSSMIEYHHWIYRPVTEFKPCDLIPLCREHHEQIHKHHAIGDTDIRRILNAAFGIDGHRAMRQFFQLEKRLDRALLAKSINRPCVQHSKKKVPQQKTKLTAWDRHRIEMEKNEIPRAKLSFNEIKERNERLKQNG